MGYLVSALIIGVGPFIPTILHHTTSVSHPDVIASYRSLASTWTSLSTQQRAPVTPTPATIFSTSPLLLEIAYLAAIGQPLFKYSLVTGGKTSTGRTSDSCFLPGNDTVVSTIKQRAANFMHRLPFDGIEAIQLVRYTANQTIIYPWTGIRASFHRTDSKDATTV